MKKLFFISGALTLAFSILFIFGILDFNHAVGRALTTGNRLYAEEAFEKALEAYNAGLQKEPENKMLNYNAAQACYQMKAYDKAIELYGKASATVDMYLNWGNSSLRLGDGTEDASQKLQHYANALEAYKQGILAFPQNVELKYNYEYVLEKLKELQNDMQNQQQDNQENQEGQDQNQQQGGGQQNQGGNPQDQQNDQQGNQQNEENSQDDQQQSEPSPASGDEENAGQAGSSPEETAQNSSEIERILQMLEKQEEQALKNNQRIRDKGKEDEHDW
jgi:Ca-activated chloride channel family protein